MIMRDTLVQNDGERMKEDMAYIMESLHNEAVYVPLTEVVSLAVYREGLSGPDMDSAGAAWGSGPWNLWSRRALAMDGEMGNGSPACEVQEKKERI